jgi:alpha-beta hydrolase superfamily lysophospholipase
MLTKNFSFQSGDGSTIFVYQWSPDPEINVKGIVQIAHGMAETAARYERFARVLTKKGYLVFANDHRGHGKSAGSLENVGYLADEDGFDWLVKDMHQLTNLIKKDYPDLPVFLFGHSMGSFATQRYIMLYGKELKGTILSGSNGSAALLHNLGFIVSGFEVKKNGRKTKSIRMNHLSFGTFNQAFKPNRTEYDWLSRDNAEVDKYIADPYCGGVFTAGFFYDFMKGLKTLDKRKNVELVPTNLPIYIFSGEKDPVGGAGKGVKKLYDTYKKCGISDISMRLYPDGRHEMLNELNRDEVMLDVVEWLDSKIK